MFRVTRRGRQPTRTRPGSVRRYNTQDETLRNPEGLPRGTSGGAVHSNQTRKLLVITTAIFAGLITTMVFLILPQETPRRRLARGDSGETLDALWQDLPPTNAAWSWPEVYLCGVVVAIVILTFWLFGYCLSKNSAGETTESESGGCSPCQACAILIIIVALILVVGSVVLIAVGGLDYPERARRRRTMETIPADLLSNVRALQRRYKEDTQAGGAKKKALNEPLNDHEKKVINQLVELQASLKTKIPEDQFNLLDYTRDYVQDAKNSYARRRHYMPVYAGNLFEVYNRVKSKIDKQQTSKKLTDKEAKEISEKPSPKEGTKSGSSIWLAVIAAAIILILGFVIYRFSEKSARKAVATAKLQEVRVDPVESFASVESSEA